MQKAIFPALFLLTFVAPPVVSAQSVKIKGSDTLLPLMQRWAQLYEKKNPQVHLLTSGGGSGAGISALLKGETDIAESSRPLTEAEKEQFRKLGKTPVDVAVAADAVEILANPANSISSLTMDQVKGIFSGTITNWKEVGGEDAKIVVYGRDSSSGTHVFLQEHALHGARFAAGTVEFPANAAMTAAVLKDKNGICYAGLAAGKALKSLRISADAKSPAFPATAENIHSTKYPLCRLLHWYLASRPTGAVKELCFWAISPEAQTVAEKMGFIPIPAEIRNSVESRL